MQTQGEGAGVGECVSAYLFAGAPPQPGHQNCGGAAHKACDASGAVLTVPRALFH